MTTEAGVAEMPKKSRTVPVSARALIQRINRALAHEKKQLKTARGTRSELTLGEYYVLHTVRNYIVEHHVDLEEMGRELEVLADYEHLAE